MAGIVHKIADMVTMAITIRFAMDLKEVRLKLESATPQDFVAKSERHHTIKLRVYCLFLVV